MLLIMIMIIIIKEDNMSIALIGGMDRLKCSYLQEAKKLDITLKVFNKSEVKLSSKIKNMDAIIIFTNKVSHRIKREVTNIAKTRSIPILMHHSSGVCALRNCLICFKKK